MRIALFRTVLTCLACFLFAGNLPAELIPGPEFQVNNYSVNPQRYPAVALDADFNFVVVWQSLEQDGSGEGVFARRYDSTGVALGAPFQVNSHFTFLQAYPAVALAANGDFVVVWSSNEQDGSNMGVFARRFSAAGTPQASEFQVNTYTFGSQAGAASPPGNAGPTIAAQPNGDFVIVWQDINQEGVGASGGIFGRRFDAAGMAIGGEFHVNTYTTGAQTYPSVDVDADGDFVVTWQSSQDGDAFGIFGRRFGSSGAASGGEFQVNTRTFFTQRYPVVSLENDGDFVVVWQSFSQDPDGDGIFARRFAANGDGRGVEFQVNTYTTGSQRYPSVGVDADGDFVVAWQSFGLDGENDGVIARRFDGTGTAVTAEFVVNDLTALNQQYAAIGINPVGDFVVTWQRGTIGTAQEIAAKRFDNVAVLDIDANGAVTALGDGIMVLRFLFEFTGAALVDDVIDEELCQRCDAAEIEAYLGTLI